LVHKYCSKRYARHVHSVVHYTSWGNQERTRNFYCRVDTYQMTSIRWSSTHHRDAHCSLSLSPLSGPSHHTDGGSQLSTTHHGRRDTKVCMWSHIQSFPWWIWLGTKSDLDLRLYLSLWMALLLNLLFFFILFSPTLLLSSLALFSLALFSFSLFSLLLSS
jgi:hypothetical protein